MTVAKQWPQVSGAEAVDAAGRVAEGAVYDRRGDGFLIFNRPGRVADRARRMVLRLVTSLERLGNRWKPGACFPCGAEGGLISG